MKKQFLISVVVCIILAACSGQNNFPLTAIPSFTPNPTLTVTSTPTRTPQPTLTPTSTITPLPPYPNKQVLFDYYVIGDHSVFDGFFDLNSFRSYSRLVLYDDGQMIITSSEGVGDGTYKQKFLSPDEIKRFLAKLETLGFYSLESNQKHDPTDTLYNYGNDYQESFDGRDYCISVNADKSRDLCVYEPDIQYLIPQMKSILQYLDNYEPAGTTPYYPDRILLWVQAGRDPYNDNLPETAILWDEHFPSLEASSPIMFIEGDMAKEIYLQFGGTNKGMVFSQNAKEYTVYIDVVLPHEKMTNAYQ